MSKEWDMNIHFRDRYNNTEKVFITINFVENRDQSTELCLEKPTQLVAANDEDYPIQVQSSQPMLFETKEKAGGVCKVVSLHRDQL